MKSRRHFLFKLALSATAPAALGSRLLGQETPAPQAPPQVPPQVPPPGKLEETDPVATALGYKEDSTKVDQQKFPQHKPEQKCALCALYTGKEGDATGPCTAFQNKLVSSGGWCAAFAVKPPPTPPAPPKP